jgi:glucose/arabinose dehydrogenase
MNPLKTIFRRSVTAAVPAFALLCAAMTVDTGAQTIPNNVTFRNFFGTMTFHKPIQFTPYPDEDSAYVVLQQTGRLITVRRQANAWVKTDSALISVFNGTNAGNEQGLLGFAFHPQFTANGKYYVYYITGSGNGVSLIAQRTAGASRRPLTSDPQTTILRMTQPFENHNGGTIGFGPDGKLYVAFGDGGSANDPGNRAQNLDTLFGKVLRLNVDTTDAYPADTTRNYGLPTDNPFYGQANRRSEIYAYGLRNPFRWSFHPLTGHMWIGDVGQNLFEEVSRVATPGANLGWPIQEGASCFNQGSPNSPLTNCTTTGHTAPAKFIQRSQARSVTGGAVFTGDPTAAFNGVYIFGDYETHHVWAMRPTGGTLADSVRLGQVFRVAAFNRDVHGRVFATSLSNSSTVTANNGVVFILESPDMRPAPVSLRGARPIGAKALRVADLRRNPEAYEWRSVEGRLLTKPMYRLSGTYIVRAKGDAKAQPQLMTMVW